MIISLIGMSGVGKSYWSKKLSKQKGFLRYDCDLEIEKKLEAVLKPLGYSGVNDLGKWMGQPYENKYLENSKKYLQLEVESMQSILDKIKKEEFKHQNLVIDTTGSVVYCPQSVLNDLKSLTRVVYFEVTQSYTDDLFRTFLSDPKPVYWGNSYLQIEGDSFRDSLIKSFPRLINYRAERYLELADKVISYKRLWVDGFDLEELIRF